MKQLHKPQWLIFAAILPTLLILIVCLTNYQVIESLLEPSHKVGWIICGSVLGVGVVALFTQAILSMIQRKSLPRWIGGVIFGGYTLFLYIYLSNSSKIIPIDIPQWMFFEGNLNFLMYSLLLLPIAYAGLLIVEQYTPAVMKRKAVARDIGIVVLIPFVWFVGLNIVVPLLAGSRLNEEISLHLFIVALIASVSLFLFFLGRVIYYFFRKRRVSTVAAVVLRVLFFLLFPVLGLYFNQIEGINILGNFTHPLFFIIAIVNGLLWLVPMLENRWLRYLLFICRSICYPYVLYFFIIFLPFLPISLLALIAVGFGFLLLTPIILMFAITPLWLQDMAFLKENFCSKFLVPITVIVCVMVLPMGILINCTLQKRTLHRVTQYLYEPSYLEERPEINQKHVEKLIEEIKQVKIAQEMFFGASENVPFISPFYKWYVLENMTLSEDKVTLIENLFLDPENSSTEYNLNEWSDGRSSLVNLGANNPHTQNFFVEQEVDSAGVTRSWIHLSIENGAFDMNEFSTTFTIPNGAYISNYYLDIEGTRKYGLLSERKSALWVYQMVTTVERRDPGLLFYGDNPNELNFRIFPFASNETRTTGIEFIHTDTLSFTFDDREIVIPPVKQIEQTLIEETNGLGAALFPVHIKALPSVQRAIKPVFVLDYSARCKGNAELYRSQIRRVLDSLQEKIDGFDVLVSNYHTKQYGENEWERAIEKEAFTGGFDLSYPLKKVLLQNYLSDTSFNRPIFLLTTSFSDLVETTPFTQWGITMPEGTNFYHINSDNDVEVYSVFDPQQRVALKQMGELSFSTPVKRWIHERGEAYFLPLTADEPCILPFKEAITGRALLELKGNNRWHKGLTIDLLEILMELNPVDRDTQWQAIINESFAAQILTEQTSFISLENEAQEKALLRKQKHVLSSSSALDIGDENEMSEPKLWMLMPLLLVILWWQKRRRDSSEEVEEESQEGLAS